jgi:hypothetical protein
MVVLDLWLAPPGRAICIYWTGVFDVPPKLPDLCTVIPMCPLCRGRMELVYDRPNAKVCVCVDCHTGISVPAQAWVVALQRGTVRANP